jgi:hypothetical protein
LSASTVWTSRVLLGGTLLSAACFAVGFGLKFAGAAAAAPVASTFGVLLLLLTPAVGLVVTGVELRRQQPQAAWIALAVLAVLGVAVAVALVAH